MNVLLIIILLFLIFAIIGVNFMKGLFYYCDYSNSRTLSGFNEDQIVTKWDCISIGGEWNKYDLIFDDILKSLVSVFVIS